MHFSFLVLNRPTSPGIIYICETELQTTEINHQNYIKPNTQYKVEQKPVTPKLETNTI